MEIEIVEFYPYKIDEKKRYLLGTLHVYLPELDLDIRGIRFVRKNKYWHVDMPHARGFDEDEQKLIKYPILNFLTPGKNKEITLKIRDKGKAYVEENFLKNEKKKPKVTSTQKFRFI